MWPAVITAIRDRANRLVFAHLNEADTVEHLHGPESAEAVAVYGATDRAVDRILEVMRPTWGRWLVVVVSDHDMEPRTLDHGLDPLRLPGMEAIADDWIGDGGTAWVRLRPGALLGDIDRVLRACPEVSGWELIDDRLRLLAHPGVAWHAGPVPLLGIHGGPAVRRTVAQVGGGHPAARAIGRAILDRPPELRDWAPTIARVLGVALVHADGRDLLEDAPSPG